MIEQIIMAIQTFDEYNKTGVDNVLLYTAMIEPKFIFMILAAMFFIVLFGIMYGTKRWTGTVDIWACITVASLITTLTAIAMSLKQGLISNYVLILTVMISVISAVFLYFSRDRY